MITLIIEEKPLLGVIPKRFNDMLRKQELISAMNRYFLHSKPIPPEWITEYNDLARERSNS